MPEKTKKEPGVYDKVKELEEQVRALQEELEDKGMALVQLYRQYVALKIKINEPLSNNDKSFIVNLP